MRRRSSSQDAELFLVARRQHEKGNTWIAAEALKNLSLRGHAASDTLLGAIHECGGDGVEIDLDKAEHYYRRAAYGSGGASAWIRLASVLEKRGDAAGAAKALQEASEYVWTGDTHVLLGFYARERGEYENAHEHYVQAMLRARFEGFSGLALVLRRTGHPLRALAVDTLRICMGPFLWIGLGRIPSRGGAITGTYVLKRLLALTLVVGLPTVLWSMLQG